ncbi:hypothetical protein ABZ397_02800 [Streptomyces sp. NPDC005876]|uniref:hypothetical protein n=1 Tax=Streptomyces sp. NPDC005876 TaxID=3157076 RepID=UPI0033CCA18E
MATHPGRDGAGGCPGGGRAAVAARVRRVRAAAGGGGRTLFSGLGAAERSRRPFRLRSRVPFFLSLSLFLGLGGRVEGRLRVPVRRRLRRLRR